MGSIKQGVVLIALGHDNYFRMAEVLAASIKVNTPTVQIAIINDGTKEINSALFDHSIIVTDGIPEHYYKTRLYELTPFDATIYLDVDMILFPGSDITKMFAELSGYSFTIMNKQTEHCIWADVKDIRELSGNNNGAFHMFYSEFIYFERGQVARTIFTLAKKRLTAKIENVQFNKGMADELAFILATMELGVLPHKSNWFPVFWHFRDKKDAHKQPYKLKETYMAYSIGGNSMPDYVKATYNNLATFYAQSIGLAKHFKALDKRLYLVNRTSL